MVLLATGLAFVLAACGPPGGLTAEEADDLRLQVNEVEQRLSSIEAIVTDMQEAEAEERQQLASEAMQEVDEARATLQNVDMALEPPPEPADDPVDGVDPLAPPGN